MTSTMMAASSNEETTVACSDSSGNEASSRQKAERRSRWSARLKRWPVQVVILIALLSGWQIASDRWIASYFISSPTAIAAQFWAWILNGTLLEHAITTLLSTVLGFLIGGFIAVLVGYTLGVSRYWAAVIEPFITALWGLPRIALIPLLIIWVGIDQKLAMTMGGILSFFLLFYNTYYGVREVSQGLIDSVRVMGGSGWDVAWRVRVPSAFVWIAAGLKMSLPMALVGVVTAEMLASDKGLGFLVRFYGNSFDTAATFAALLALLLLGVALDRILALISRSALLWKNPER